MSEAASITFEVHDLSPRTGSEIRSDKATLLSGEKVQEIRTILERRGVVVFPQISFTDDEQMAFTRTLGVMAKDSADGEDGVYKITMDLAEDPQAEYLKGAFYWHIDGTTSETPILASIMSCECPAPEGGETEFSNTYAAYDDLSDADKARYEGVRVYHSLVASQRYVNPEPRPKVLKGLAFAVIEQGAMIGPAQPAGGGGELGFAIGASLDPEADLVGSRRSFSKAWDPKTQTAVWQVQLPGSWPGGVLATAGGLVFQGGVDGKFVAYDAKNGKRVWSFQAQAPVIAPPIAYSVGGKQYITVLTGNGGTGGGIMAIGNQNYATDYRLPRHVLTFAIGGKDKLPAFTPPDRTRRAIRISVPTWPGSRPERLLSAPRAASPVTATTLSAEARHRTCVTRQPSSTLPPSKPSSRMAHSSPTACRHIGSSPTRSSRRCGSTCAHGPSSRRLKR